MTRTFDRRRLRVYIAGPITVGDTWENVQNGLRWGRRMLADGLAPYVPHLDAYMGLADGNWNALLEWDLEWVAASEALFRIAGESKGATLEAEVAASLGLPLFQEDEYGELLHYADLRGLTGQRSLYSDV